MTINLVSFDDALKIASKYTKKHLLLGNGFSIACNPNIFTYHSLYKQAKKTHFENIPKASKLFDEFETEDFEVIIKILEDSSKTLFIFDESMENIAKNMHSQAEALKTALIKTIADNHPAIPNNIEDSKFSACRKFLRHFLNKGQVYTLNYDLLLYWAGLHDEQPSEKTLQFDFNDGFVGNSENDKSGYVIWQGESNHKQKIHYLHGAIHLFDAGSELKKYTWKNNGIPLLEQAQGAMKKNMFPLFVAEGRSEKKLEKIKHSAYLYHSYKSFSTQMDKENQALFIFGHSFAENDDHILRKISDGKVAHIFVSIFGSPTDKNNKSLIDRVEQLKQQRENRKKEYPKLEVTFFDAASAKVWG